MRGGMSHGTDAIQADVQTLTAYAKGKISAETAMQEVESHNRMHNLRYESTSEFITRWSWIGYGRRKNE
jgi:hypothetical protein